MADAPGVGELLLGPLGALDGFAFGAPGVRAPTFAPAAGVCVWTLAAGAGAEGGPDETPALVVPLGVAADAVALTPPVPAEAEAPALACAGTTLALALALAEGWLGVGADTVALADAAGVFTDAEAVVPLDPVETETDADGVCKPAPADGSCGPSAAAVPACARANAPVAAAIANVRPRIHALARIARE